MTSDDDDSNPKMTPRRVVRVNVPESFKETSRSLERINQMFRENERFQETVKNTMMPSERVREMLRHDVNYRMQELMQQMDESQRIATDAIKSATEPLLQSQLAAARTMNSIEPFLRRHASSFEAASKALQEMLGGLRIELPDWNPVVERLQAVSARSAPHWAMMSTLHLDRARLLAEQWPSRATPFIPGDVIDSTATLVDDLVDVYEDPQARSEDTGWMHEVVDRSIEAHQALVDDDDLPEPDLAEPFAEIDDAFFTHGEHVIIAGIRNQLRNPGPDGLRHLCSGLRQLHNSVLERMGKDDEVVAYIESVASGKLKKRLIRKQNGKASPSWTGYMFYGMRHQPESVLLFMLDADESASQYVKKLNSFLHNNPVRNEPLVAQRLVLQLEVMLRRLAKNSD